ncbi:MAG: bifunctional D-glycero-beta-D-manno-heptose-7-phosphate kinase/D-glycero-beta-D-manno-heptose 1-phosphate adenylyltransferase HldE [Pseudomonadota bacterium]|nr:bifunctional D-glycero-beta-D-manno-heptose-7-phosphate kinase/D-glycero-beta-D-manno-heptose 1-phosphate adenylyltransferase HldE [Pseudomonadota bacterium]MEC9214855.1 bifunctional D-glycero-beta-D-manno-heptose-7-phosphate kinase/D-glycero-beta-D-manno-heptose 1-phosphate adenylyltransferase HldE [Pseudomonadota bacterium]MED5356194.1 bifunctional D-glycero-beta-D-manno-heptose-7-phosphate kinase/D-glycero-beta-D-manno-heptose 1-phosphate adenylyltransferase HldE [Pseudomonadota bacterium]
MTKLPKFSDAKVLVIGDVMLDRFWHGAATRISPEAPVPVVKVAGVDDRPGGAGNVAINLAALGVETTLSGLVGDDEHAKQLRSAVEAKGVRWSVMPCPADTIVKLRVLSRNQQLIRMDFEAPLDDYADESFLQYASNLIAEHDVVLLSDYAKGTLTNIEALISACRVLNTPVLVDPKGADFSRYAGATLITPNLSEFEAVVGACHQDDTVISARARHLCEQHGFEAVLVTRSERGMTLQSKEGEPLHLPALAREVFDVTGAGDTVISAMAAGLASQDSFENSTRLANVAAGLVVGKVGTATVTREELQGALLQSEGDVQDLPAFGVVTEQEAVAAVARLKAEGQRVVMTNGCFDLLHPGHVTYLSQAAALADVLIVAVNDDASVTRLKGPDRPINGIESRMSVLAGLRSVSYVVAFSEDTPARLIEAISPDVLVKGGDYTIKEIAGHEHVLESGGEVIILEFVEGFSTTATIKRISTDS